MSLDEQDKQWMSEQFRTGLQQLRTELGVDLGHLGTEFRTDLEQLRTEFRTDLGQLRTDMGHLRTEFRTELEQLRTELHADLERTETNLLTAFHQWASPAEARMRSYSSTLHAFDLELNDLKDRVKKIEESIHPAQ